MAINWANGSIGQLVKLMGKLDWISTRLMQMEGMDMTMSVIGKTQSEPYLAMRLGTLDDTNENRRWDRRLGKLGKTRYTPLAWVRQETNGAQQIDKKGKSAAK